MSEPLPPVAQIIKDYIDETEANEAAAFAEAEAYFEDVRTIVGNPAVAQIVMVTETELALQEMEQVLFGGEDDKGDRRSFRTAVGRFFGQRPRTAPHASKPADPAA